MGGLIIRYGKYKYSYITSTKRQATRESWVWHHVVDEEDGGDEGLALTDGVSPCGGAAFAPSAVKFSSAILNSASNRSFARTTFDWR